MCVLWMLVVLL